MEDCKFRLPCGRCEKLGAPCDAPKEPKECEHSWDTVKFEMTNNGFLYHFKCSKCGEVKVLPLATNT